jgi:hypothetical protein
MTYFLPREEQNKLRNKLIIIAWRDQGRSLSDSNEAAAEGQ